MKEERKDIKKMKYEEPRLVKLSSDAGAGQVAQCENGSGEEGVCSDGNAAQGASCSTGNGFIT